MREIVIISGKGGTGKTSLLASFALLSNRKNEGSTPTVVADCDVDAPDLHLLLHPEHQRTEPFVSGHRAVIRETDCCACGLCAHSCRFDAIRMTLDTARVNDFACEGCGLCRELCPVSAIDFAANRCGSWYVSDSRAGVMVHARLHPGEENSGRLVSLVREEARKMATSEKAETIWIDGPPGVGCPVIASITGANAVVVITEPSVSGEHDLKRVQELCLHFNVQVNVCINKWDLSPEMTEWIERQCRESGIALAGRIPYDRAFIESQLNGHCIVETDSPAAVAVEQVWEKII